jgi:polar amino acid transport system substrate-binding protein
MRLKYRSGIAVLAFAMLLTACSSSKSASSAPASSPGAGSSSAASAASPAGSSSAASAASPAASSNPASPASAGAVTVDGAPVAYDATVAAMLPPAIASSKTLKDITYDNAPPDTFVLNGQTVGWEVDLGRAAAVVLGLKYVVTTSDAFDTFIPGLQNGRWDVSFSSLIQSPDRLKQIDVVTYYSVGTQFASKAGSALAIAQPTDVCGHTVATLAGSVFVDQLTAIQALCTAGGKPKITVQSYPSASNMTLAVANGRADLFTDSANQLAYILIQTPGQFQASALNYEPVAEGVGVTKSNGLSKAIGAAMDDLINTGVYAAVMKKWGLNTGLATSATVYTGQ